MRLDCAHSGPRWRSRSDEPSCRLAGVMDGTASTGHVTSQQVTVAEAAAILGVSVVTVRRMIKRGQLEAQRVIRPQGSAYVVTVPMHGTGNAQDAPPTEQPAQNVS